jgi:hypothetical protein
MVALRGGGKRMPSSQKLSLASGKINFDLIIYILPWHASLSMVEQGISYYLFPTASHNRFEHCLGTTVISSLQMLRLTGFRRWPPVQVDGSAHSEESTVLGYWRRTCVMRRVCWTSSRPETIERKALQLTVQFQWRQSCFLARPPRVLWTWRTQRKP